MHSTIILVSHAHILVDSGACAMCDCGRGYYQSLFTYVDNFNKQINKKHMKNNRLTLIFLFLIKGLTFIYWCLNITKTFLVSPSN